MADIKKTVSVNVKGKGVKKTTGELNNLNDAIKKADKGNQAHSKSSRTLDRNLKGNAKMSSNASKNFSKQAQNMQGVLVPAYAEVAARVFALTAAYSALNRAAQFNVLMKGQQAFAAQTGKNMAAIARSLQEASGYMLDFQQASSSTALGTTAGLTQKTLLRMTKGARAASVALGIDMTNAMDRLTRGIVKAEPEILDELGVIIRLDKVYQDFAFSVNKTTSQLTEQEKQTARSTAILGQLESKFGEIGEKVEANPFAKLAASVTDLVSSFGAGATDIIGPFISRLADSTELLIGLMAMVVRSLAGKVLPIFNDIDKKLSSVVNRAKAFQEASRNTRLARMETAGNKLGILKEEQASKLQEFFKLLGTSGGNALQESIKKNGNTIKAIFNKSASAGLTAAIRGARADIAKQQAAGVVDPVARTPALEGFSLSQISTLENLKGSLRTIGKEITNIGKATKGSMVLDFFTGFSYKASRAASSMASLTESFTKGINRFNELTIAEKKNKVTGQADMFVKSSKGYVAAIIQVTRELGKMAAAGAAAAAAFKSMSKALNLIVGFFAIKMTVTWIAEEALGMSVAFGKASDALNDLNADLQETLDLIESRGSKRLNIGTTFAESLNQTEAVSSIADGMATAMEKAATKLDEEQLGNAFLGGWYDNFLDLFGAGIADKIEEGVSKGLTSLASNMKPQVWDSFKKKLRDQLEKSLTPQMQGAKQLGAGTAETLTGVGAAAYGGSALYGMITAGTIGSGGLALPAIALAAGLYTIYDGFNRAIEGLENLSSTASESADSILGVLDQVNEGTLSVSVAIEELDRLMNFGSREKAIAYYRDLSEASKLFAEQTKASTDAVKALSDASNNLQKARTSFSRSLIQGGDLKDFADAQKAMRETLGAPRDLVSNEQKFKALNQEGYFGPKYSKLRNAEEFLGFEENIKKAKDELIRINQSVYDDLEKKEREKTAQKKRIIEEERKYAIRAAQAYANEIEYMGTEKNIITKLLGGDAEKLYERELKQAMEVAHITQTIAESQRFGNSALKENAKLQQKILEIERDKLIQRRALGNLQGVELENLNGQISLLDRQIEEAGRTAVEASKFANELAGTVETLTQKLNALEKDSPDLIKFGKTKIDMILRDFNALKNSLTQNFDEAQQLSATLSVLDEANKSGMTTSTQGKRMLKDWLLLYTAQGRVINDRNKQITEELVLLDVNTRHMGEQEDLLDYRLKAAKIDLDTTNSLLRIDKERLKLREAYVKLADLEAQRRDAAMRESLQDYKSAIEGIASAFGSAISESVQDFILDRDSDTDWRTALAESFAEGSGNMVAGMFQKGIFGNQGLLSGAAKEIFGFGDKELDFLFPKTELEVIDSGLAGIKEEIQKSLELLAKIEGNTLRSASGIEQIPGVMPYSPDYIKGIKEKYPNLIEDEIGNTMGSTGYDRIARAYMEGSKGTSSMVAANTKYGYDANPFSVFGGSGFGGPRSNIVSDRNNPWTVIDKLGLQGKVATEKYIQLNRQLDLQNQILKMEGKPTIKFKPDTGGSNAPASNTPGWIRDLFSSTQQTFTNVKTAIVDNATAVGDSLKNTLKFGFEDLIVNDNFNARMLASNFVGSVGNSFMSSAADAATGMIFDSLGFAAKGGIAMGGIKGYASGGIVSAPHIGVVGEGKYNEAIVPLPDGKAIPVVGNTGGSNNNVTVNVSVDSNGQANAQAEGEGNMQQLGYQISQVVQEEIMRQQRPGGLLNSTGTRSY